ncbi:hypothetical protein LT85_3082 [Collimonas arenae]|uniref:Uncharacterized protein n=1 Tax=Collimonas arenae TaxID=279058 RepID=A0A0A1FEQ0_9BURK|nr:hypothetical protein LT85_3082 [Collimonas arenae]
MGGDKWICGFGAATNLMKDFISERSFFYSGFINPRIALQHQ